MIELTKPEIEQYVAGTAKRKKIQRDADCVERELKPIKEKIIAYVEENGGSDRTTTHYGYVLALMPRAGTVPWKNEFIAMAGAQAASDLQAKAEPSFTLSVEPVVAP